MKSPKFLNPEDYMDSAFPAGCSCGNESEERAIPQQRVMAKLDSYLNAKDYEEAERHLLYWMSEADRLHDLRGQLMVSNEMIGLYRKTGKQIEAYAYAEKALSLLKEMDFEESVSAGTTYVNAATAYNAFGEHEKALELYEKARAVYEGNPAVPDHLRGGLYNNMALSCKALGRYDEAFALYEQAMRAMAEVPGGVLEQAITCLNMADAVAAQQGLEAGEARISELLDRAHTLLQDPSAPQDGYYAFVCEKCAPVFDYYGYFLTAAELRDEAGKIYDRA